MSDSANSAPPLPSPMPPPLPPRLELTEIAQSKRPWTLELHPDHFSVHSEFDPQPLIYTRAELWDKADVMEGMRLLVLKKPRPITLQFTPEGLRQFSEWLRPSASGRLRAVLKQRYAWALPLAVVIGVSSFPIKGDPAAGVKELPFDPLAIVLAGLLVGVWVWAKYRPMRVIFLVDAAWFALAALRNITGILYDGRGWGWGFFGLLLGWMAVRGVVWFVRFGPPKAPAQAEG